MPRGFKGRQHGTESCYAAGCRRPECHQARKLAHRRRQITRLAEMCGHCYLDEAKAKGKCGSCLEYQRRTGQLPSRAVIHRRFRLRLQRQWERVVA